MRARGTGQKDQLKSGKWRARVPVAGRLKTLAIVATEDEADQLLDAAAIVRQRKGTGNLSKRMTLVELGAIFFRSREGAVATVRDERNRWKNHVAPSPLAALPLDGVRATDVYAFRDELTHKRSDKTGEQISRQTAKHALTLVRLAFQHAVEIGVLSTSPAVGVKLKRSRADVVEDRWTYLLPDEQERLLRAIPMPERALVAIAMYTGLRQSELFSLRLRDFVVMGTAPHVIVRMGKEGAATKSGKLRRVPLFGAGLAAAKAWLEMLNEYASSKFRGGHYNPLQLVFPNRKGQRRADAKAPPQWKAWKEAAGLHIAKHRHDGRAVRWHDLRHTCASSLVAGWWTPTPWRLELVQAYMGHSSISVTQRYAHLAPSVLDEAAAGGGGGKGPTRGQLSANTPELAELYAQDVRPSKPRVAGSNPAGRASDIAALFARRDVVAVGPSWGDEVRGLKRALAATTAPFDAADRFAARLAGGDS